MFPEADIDVACEYPPSARAQAPGGGAAHEAASSSLDAGPLVRAAQPSSDPIAPIGGGRPPGPMGAPQQRLPLDAGGTTLGDAVRCRLRFRGSTITLPITCSA